MALTEFWGGTFQQKSRFGTNLGVEVTVWFLFSTVRRKVAVPAWMYSFLRKSGWFTNTKSFHVDDRLRRCPANSQFEVETVPWGKAYCLKNGICISKKEDNVHSNRRMNAHLSYGCVFPISAWETDWFHINMIWNLIYKLKLSVSKVAAVSLGVNEVRVRVKTVKTHWFNSELAVTVMFSQTWQKGCSENHQAK